MSGTASLKASEAAAMAARRPDSSGGTASLYSGELEIERLLSSQLTQGIVSLRISEVGVEPESA